MFSAGDECIAVTICNSQLSAINIISLISLFSKMNEITVKIKINLYALLKHISFIVIIKLLEGVYSNSKML